MQPQLKVVSNNTNIGGATMFNPENLPADFSDTIVFNLGGTDAVHDDMGLLLKPETYEFQIALKNPSEANLIDIREKVSKVIEDNYDPPYEDVSLSGEDEEVSQSPLFKIWVDAMGEVEDILFDGYSDEQKRNIKIKLTSGQRLKIQEITSDCLSLGSIVKALREATAGN